MSSPSFFVHRGNDFHLRLRKTHPVRSHCLPLGRVWLPSCRPMSDSFVHLHLHTEFSLLDGACRVDELLDEAVRLKMPALAVTEHGNMFSSVMFHDQARKQGINPILGCEVYVAPGDRRTKSGVPGETQNHLILLSETLEGYHNLIKLVSSGYTEGFYYKPRIDKELLAKHSKGLIGLSSCLKGEVAEGLSHHVPVFNYTNNLVGTANVLAAALRATTSTLMTGSVAVMGRPPCHRRAGARGTRSA